MRTRAPCSLQLCFQVVCLALLFCNSTAAQSCYTLSWAPWDASRTTNMALIGLSANSTAMYVCQAYVPNPWQPSESGYVYHPGVTTGQGFCAMYLSNQYQAIKNFSVLYSDVPLSWIRYPSSNRLPTGLDEFNGKLLYSCRVPVTGSNTSMSIAGAQDDGSPSTCWGVKFSAAGAGSATSAGLSAGDLLAAPAGIPACNGTNPGVVVTYSNTTTSSMNGTTLPSPTPQPLQGNDTVTWNNTTPAGATPTNNTISPSPSPQPQQGNGTVTSNNNTAMQSCYTLSWGPWDASKVANMTLIGTTVSGTAMYVCRAYVTTPWAPYGHRWNPGFTTGQGYCAVYTGNLNNTNFEVLYSDVPLIWQRHPTSNRLPTGWDEYATHPMYSCKVPEFNSTNNATAMAGSQDDGSADTCWGVALAADGSGSIARIDLSAGYLLVAPSGVPACNITNNTTLAVVVTNPNSTKDANITILPSPSPQPQQGNDTVTWHNTAAAQSCYNLSWGPWDASKTSDMALIGNSGDNTAMYVCRAYVPNPWQPYESGYVYHPGVTTGQGFCAMYLSNQYQAINNFSVLYSDVRLTWIRYPSSNRLPIGFDEFNGKSMYSCRVPVTGSNTSIIMAGAQNDGSPSTCWGVTFLVAGAGSAATGSLSAGDLLAAPVGIPACDVTNSTTPAAAATNLYTSTSNTSLSSPSPQPQQGNDTVTWNNTPPAVASPSNGTLPSSPSLQPQQGNNTVTWANTTATQSCYNLSWGPWDASKISNMALVGMSTNSTAMYVCRAYVPNPWQPSQSGYVYHPGVTSGQGNCAMYLYGAVTEFQVLYSDVPLTWERYPSSNRVQTGVVDFNGMPFFSCRVPQSADTNTMSMAGSQDDGSPSTCWGVVLPADGSIGMTAADLSAGDILAAPAGVPSCSPQNSTTPTVNTNSTNTNSTENTALQSPSQDPVHGNDTATKNTTAAAQSCYTLSWGPWDTSRTSSMALIGMSVNNTAMYVCRAYVPNPWQPWESGYVYHPGVTTGQGYCAMYLSNQYQAITAFEVLYSDVPITWQRYPSSNQVATGLDEFNGMPFHSCRVLDSANSNTVSMAGAQNDGSPSTCWGVTFSADGSGSATTSDLFAGDILAAPAGVPSCNPTNNTPPAVLTTPNDTMSLSPSSEPQHGSYGNSMMWDNVTAACPAGVFISTTLNGLTVNWTLETWLPQADDPARATLLRLKADADPVWKASHHDVYLWSEAVVPITAATRLPPPSHGIPAPLSFTPLINNSADSRENDNSTNSSSTSITCSVNSIRAPLYGGYADWYLRLLAGPQSVGGVYVDVWGLADLNSGIDSYGAMQLGPGGYVRSVVKFSGSWW